MTIHVDYSKPLNAGRNTQLARDLTGWTAIAEHVLVWDHITNFGGFEQPTPNIYPIGRSLQWLATLPHITGYFAEGSWNTRAAEFASLRAWLIARLLWDPHQDVEELVAEFCRHYFGAAGPSIVRYINFMHASIGQSGDILSEKTQVDMAMFNLDFVQRADRMFDDAERAVLDDSTSLAHVRQARMPVDYVILVRRHEYGEEAKRRGFEWEPNTPARLSRFMRTATLEGLTQYRQGGDMRELATLLSVERHTPTTPEFVSKLPSSAWRDFQDLSFNRYDTAAIVADASASDGSAARIIGNSATWALQLNVEKIPKQGEWELYAAIRVDAEPGHDFDIGAIVGSFPPMTRFDTIPIKKLNDGQYHLIKMPGGPFTYSASNRGNGIYVRAPNVEYVKYVFVDRIIAIKIGS